ncbi:DUF6503 family protein [Emticicia oligotrophica]|uniref:DUF6503 family protein n=1 Tax=Emticicia oligotrophica TaxID=312279 RepID=UPI00273AFDAD|nr:DUF6503 family protein [Emticicia oligotrophica]
MKNIILFSVLISFLLSCQSTPKDAKAKNIVEKSIEVHGGKRYDNFKAEFDFRKFHIKFIHQTENGGSLRFQYERSSKDSLGNITTDMINNEGFVRKNNGVQVKLSEKDIIKYTNAVNSVAYFVLLPFKLRDKAVNLEYVGEIIIENKKYDKIKVWFDKAGGGNDFEDIYCYWFNQDTHTLDYIAYANGGPRFRRATTRQNIGGIIFQDYENYVITDIKAQTNDYDKAFIAGKDSLLSVIENKNITVQ